jgi:hypothetical protein
MPIVLPGHAPLAHAEGAEGLSLMLTAYPPGQAGQGGVPKGSSLRRLAARVFSPP